MELDELVGVFKAKALEGNHIVRACFPMPRDTPTWSRGPDGHYPVTVYNDTGGAYKTQLEVCRRDSFGEPAVVEVLAAVPAGRLSPGKEYEFNVYSEPSSSAGMPEPGPGVWNLVVPFGSMGLRLADGRGTTYRTSLTGIQRGGSRAMRWERFGPVVCTGMRPTWLKPDRLPATSPYGGAVQAFISIAEGCEAVELLLNFHNAAIPLIGDFHFDALELAVPEDWFVTSEWPDPAMGEPYVEDGFRIYPLISKLEGGRLNLIDMMRERHWRLVVHRKDNFQTEGGRSWGAPVAAREGNRETASWSSTLTPRYLVQCGTIPVDLSNMAEDIRTEARRERQAFKTWNVTPGGGAPPAHYLQFRAGTYGGWTGGWDTDPWIRPDVLSTGEPEGLLALEIEFCRYAARQRALYASGGMPIDPKLFVDEDGTPGWSMFNERFQPGDDGPFGYFDAGDGNRDPERDAHYRHVLKGDPADQYDKGIDPIDDQHRQRADKAAKWLATCANDPLAKLYLQKAATLVRMSAMETGAGPMVELNEELERRPGMGFGGFGRETGWRLDVVVSAYAFGDDTMRRRFIHWIFAQVNALRLAQTPIGMFGGKSTGKVAEQAPFSKPAEYAVTRPNEELYIAFALLGAHNSVLSSPFPGFPGPYPDEACREAILRFCSGFWFCAWKRDAIGGSVGRGNFERLALRQLGDAGMAKVFEGPEDLPWDIQEEIPGDSFQSALVITLGVGLEGYEPGPMGMIDALKAYAHGASSLPEAAKWLVEYARSRSSFEGARLGSTSEVLALAQRIFPPS